MKSSKTSRLEMRANVINYVYQFQLLNEEFNSDQAFESGNFSDIEIKMIEALSKHYDKLVKLVRSFTKANWSWGRIAPLERSILIFGAFELSYNDTALVINELVTIAQGYIPGDAYKFIHSVLDKIGAYYAKLKTNKKLLKAQGNWKPYKQKFENRHIRLSYSFIALLFNPKADPSNLAKIEKSLISSPKKEDMFVKAFKTLSKTNCNNVDWESFGRYMWYQYQTSTYWKDVKKDTDNIYNKDNYVELNSKRRRYYQNWLSTLDIKNRNFNNIVTKILGKVS